MKVRNIVRKAVTLGSGAALVGSTLMGALAYDLGDYPGQFVVDGQFEVDFTLDSYTGGTFGPEEGAPVIDVAGYATLNIVFNTCNDADFTFGGDNVPNETHPMSKLVVGAVEVLEYSRLTLG